MLLGEVEEVSGLEVVVLLDKVEEVSCLELHVEEVPDWEVVADIEFVFDLEDAANFGEVFSSAEVLDLGGLNFELVLESVVHLSW